MDNKEGYQVRYLTPAIALLSAFIGDRAISAMRLAPKRDFNLTSTEDYSRGG
jgi:hypothetical protein